MVKTEMITRYDQHVLFVSNAFDKLGGVDVQAVAPEGDGSGLGRYGLDISSTAIVPWPPTTLGSL